MRPRNWDVELVRWADSRRGRPYVWGHTDCGSLVRQAMAVVLGGEPFPDLPVWEDADEAKAALRTLGGFSRAMQAVGAHEVPPSFVQSGDLAVTPSEPLHPAHLAVAVAGKALVTTAEHGVRVADLGALPSGTVFWRLP